MAFVSRILPVVAGVLSGVAAGPMAQPITTTTTAAALVQRSVIPHTDVFGFAEAVPTGIVGQLYEAYKSYLDVQSACDPYPAIDSEGNTRSNICSLERRES